MRNHPSKAITSLNPLYFVTLVKAGNDLTSPFDSNYKGKPNFIKLQYNNFCKINISSMKNYDAASVKSMLFKKYLYSQTYFYTNKINQIVKEKRTNVNILYEDVQYMCDEQQNLKRWYQQREYDNKMFTFKEYYFYHQDCPRIFMKHIEETYGKWQDKRRDLIYKKLKLIYNQTYSSDQDSHFDKQKSKNYVGVTHFLMDVSEYNPFSKKYYLRVESKRQKQKLKIHQQEKKQRTKRDLEGLNKDLSMMLNNMSMLSEISTLSIQPQRSGLSHKFSKFSTALTRQDTEKSSSKNKSTSLSNTNSVLKFNFKKNKNKESIEKLILLKANPKKQTIKQFNSNSKSKQIPQAVRMSPKFSSNRYENMALKSKSIFSVSSFGGINKKTQIKLTSKRDQLKLTNQPKKKTLEKHQNEKYQSNKEKRTKNLVIKVKSSTKLEPQRSLEKIRKKQMSAGKTPKKTDQFSDKKLIVKNEENRMRSIKSQFAASTKKSLFQLKPFFQLQKGKKTLLLKNE